MATRAATIDRCFAATAQRYASATAIHDYLTDAKYSYADVAKAAAEVAARIRRLLLLPLLRRRQRQQHCTDDATEEEEEPCVVLSVAEGPAMVVLVMACAFAGVCFVPVELAKTPPRRTRAPRPRPPPPRRHRLHQHHPPRRASSP